VNNHYRILSDKLAFVSRLNSGKYKEGCDFPKENPIIKNILFKWTGKRFLCHFPPLEICSGKSKI
jgi:hypothetical protein